MSEFHVQFSDGELAVRLSVHTAVEMCARTRDGAQHTQTDSVVAV